MVGEAPSVGALASRQCCMVVETIKVWNSQIPIFSYSGKRGVPDNQSVTSFVGCNGVAWMSHAGAKKQRQWMSPLLPSNPGRDNDAGRQDKTRSSRPS